MLLKESVTVFVALTVKEGPEAVIPATCTDTGPEVAPGGTLATICVLAQLVGVAFAP